MTLHIDDEKLHQQLARLAEFRDPSQPGWTRRSFSPEYQEARRWLYQQMESVGLTPRIDAGGNLVGQHEGPKKSLLITGSHTDTVIGGGRFDGMFGVLAGIECARATCWNMAPMPKLTPRSEAVTNKIDCGRRLQMAPLILSGAITHLIR